MISDRISSRFCDSAAATTLSRRFSSDRWVPTSWNADFPSSTKGRPSGQTQGELPLGDAVLDRGKQGRGRPAVEESGSAEPLPQFQFPAGGGRRRSSGDSRSTRTGPDPPVSRSRGRRTRSGGRPTRGTRHRGGRRGRGDRRGRHFACNGCFHGDLRQLSRSRTGSTSIGSRGGLGEGVHQPRACRGSRTGHRSGPDWRRSPCPCGASGPPRTAAWLRNLRETEHPRGALQRVRFPEDVALEFSVPGFFPR